MDLGIFVSASASADTVGRVGYFGGNAGGVQTAADTPEESFRNGTTWAEFDLNWVDGRGTTATTWNAMNAVNGEGSFTPTGNSQTTGVYPSTTGFWFSRPTSTPGTGQTANYSGSTTLASGAALTSTVTAIYAPGTNATVAGQIAVGPSCTTISPGGSAQTFPYTGSISGTPTYVSPLSAKGSTTFNAPTVTTNSAGQVVVRMSFTFTTNQAITAGTAKPYAQIISTHTFGLSRPGLLGFQIAADITGMLTPSAAVQPIPLCRVLTPRTCLSLSGAWAPAWGRRLWSQFLHNCVACRTPPLKLQPSVASPDISHGRSRQLGAGPAGPAQGCETVAVAADEQWRAIERCSRGPGSGDHD